MNTLELQQRLKALGFDPGPVDGISGAKTRAAIVAFQERENLDPDGVVGQRTLAALGPAGGGDDAGGADGAPITTGRMHDFAPLGRPDILAAFVAGAGEIFDAGITTPLRLAHFLAQVYPETGGLQKLSESLNYSVEGLRATFGRHRISDADCHRYGRAAGRPANQEAIANVVYGGEWGRANLGNIERGDGWKYRGGGDFQTTGRANYRRAGHENDPDALRAPASALTAALKFWTDNRLARFADADDAAGLRHAINGGTNGLDVVKAQLPRAKRIFV